MAPPGTDGSSVRVVRPNVPRQVAGSAVIVHDRDDDEWTGMSREQFEREFEWLPERPDTRFAVGDLGVF